MASSQLNRRSSKRPHSTHPLEEHRTIVQNIRVADDSTDAYAHPECLDYGVPKMILLDSIRNMTDQNDSV